MNPGGCGPQPSFSEAAACLWALRGSSRFVNTKEQVTHIVCVCVHMFACSLVYVCVRVHTRM